MKELGPTMKEAFGTWTREEKMAVMKATLIHGRHEGQDTYEYEMADELLDASPVRTMQAFMEYMDEAAHLGHLDYEINAAIKEKEGNVTTVIGAILFSETNRQPSPV